MVVKMKFKIVDGETSDFNTFKKMYLNPDIRTAEIKSALNMGQIKFQNWGKDVAKETGKIRKWNRATQSYEIIQYTPEEKKNNYKYYSYSEDSNGFLVRKIIDGEHQCFGVYESEYLAKGIVEKLKKCNWDKTQLPMIKKELGLC